MSNPTDGGDAAGNAAADALRAQCEDIARNARDASAALRRTKGSERVRALNAIASCLEAGIDSIIEANAQDLATGRENGLSAAMMDRLELNAERITAIAHAVREIAEQTDPVGQLIQGRVLSNGIRLEQRRVPIGTILIIYESRPNVTADAAALCLKSGNAVILRGGKEAAATNHAIADAVRAGLRQADLPADAVQLVNTPDRAAVGHLLKMDELIDLCIPRGGESLIRAVVEQSRIPVIKHYTGNCHVYVHADADIESAIAICMNAKTHRTGVCNAAETILLHSALVPTGGAAKIIRELAGADVEIRGDETCRAVYKKSVPVDEEDYAAEFLDKIVAVRFVDSIDEAIQHINKYGSKHTDAILTQSIGLSEQFINEVDTANAMINCSTRFSDGGQYGLGAEIGISTDKLHARGPMGAQDLTSFQWVCRGNGQTRM